MFQSKQGNSYHYLIQTEKKTFDMFEPSLTPVPAHRPHHGFGHHLDKQATQSEIIVFVCRSDGNFFSKIEFYTICQVVFTKFENVA